MSAERAELERLRKLKRMRDLESQAKAPGAASAGPEAAVPEPGNEASARNFAALRGGAQGATAGFGDEIGGLIQALGSKYLPESMGGGGASAQRSSLGDLYRLNRDTFRREDTAAQEAHPWIGGLGGLAGGLMTARLMPGAGQSSVGATLPQLMGRGTKAGALSGGIYALGSGTADLSALVDGRLPETGDMLRAGGQAALGSVLGGSLGGLVPAVAAGAGAAARGIGRVTAPIMDLVRGGYVKPTPEAARTMERGAKLSLGQMDPSSLFGRTEELAAKTATGGPLTALRSRGESTTRDAILKAARAEGAAAPTARAPVEQQLQELRAGSGKLYEEALDREVVYPELYEGAGKWRGLLTDWSSQGAGRTKGAFELAAQDRSIDAAPSVRERALTWLTDQAKSLRPRKSGADAGAVDAASVHALRTQIRDRIRGLGNEGDDRALKEIYGRAEEFTTELLHGQLPPESSTALKAADAAYKNLLATERAANSSAAFRNNREFTPDQLLQAIRSGGATPEFEAIARDAHAVLSPQYTPTGLQGAAVASLPGYKYLGPVWANLVNSSPTLAAHALRPSTGPGLLSRTLSATGRGLEGAARDSRLTPVQWSLYDALYGGPMRSGAGGSPQ